MPRREIDASEAVALSALSEAAWRGEGWKRKTVRGWLFGAEVNERARSSVASDYLQRLRNAGMVRGEPVHDPGRPAQPLVLWRITQHGEDSLARREGREPRTISAPGSDLRDGGVIYITRRAWQCLRVLQRDPDWVRWPDVVTEVRRRYRIWIYTDDRKMLLNRDLAETTEGGGGRGDVLVRATRTGRGVRLVDGRANPNLVQIRLSAAVPPEDLEDFLAAQALSFRSMRERLERRRKKKP